jgi:hypothetical protein
VQALLTDALASCSERTKSLVYSVNKNRSLFPIELSDLKKITEDQKESIDALLFRYSQCVAVIQDQIFRGIGLLEEEDLSDLSQRDKTNLMEKLGVIVSASGFREAAVLRNKFAHHYPEESQQQLDKLNKIIVQAEKVVEIFDHIVGYVAEKQLIANAERFGNRASLLTRLAL